MLLVAAALANPFPSQRPADFVVEYSSGGGMSPYRIHERCDATGCVLDTLSARGKRIYRVGAASPADLDACWAALVAHSPDRIESVMTAPTYDASTDTVVISGGGVIWSFGSGSASEIAPSSQEDYRAVVAPIDALVSKSATKKTPPPPP